MTNLLSADCKIGGSHSNGDEGSSCLGFDLVFRRQFLESDTLSCIAKGKILV